MARTRPGWTSSWSRRCAPPPPRDFEEPTERLRAAGIRVEVPVVAVHASMSRLGALDRYLQQLQAFGQGRMIDHMIHDACCEGVARATGRIEPPPCRRSLRRTPRATGVYSNRLDEQGERVNDPGAPHAVTGECDRRWSEQEFRVFASSTGRTLQTIETLPAEMREAARDELGTIAAIARPLLHPAADTAGPSGLCGRPGGCPSFARARPERAPLRPTPDLELPLRGFSLHHGPTAKSPTGCAA
ncbi:zeta toxin family protein [Streptomyces sp. NPDC087908]|uniref:zeta toxin family protein n=1 Tax=Streptomyces sp. NPDC087908 TaxID=3365820 RepID=UPI00383052AA